MPPGDGIGSPTRRSINVRPPPLPAPALPALLALLLSVTAVLFAVSPALANGVPLLEEFNGPAGASPNPAVWSLDTGGAWGNGQELQAYTSSPQNASLDGHGDLAITARHETYTGADGITREYTSAQGETGQKFAFTYGQIAARIKVPSGAGLWPAFWALGESSATVDSWPGTGEIDVMELLGENPSVMYGTLHGPLAGSAEGYKVQRSYHARSSLANGFHIYSADWSPGAITFAVDGHPYRTVTPAELPAGATWPFNHPFHLVLNLAVGGKWGGAPNSSTAWPAQMVVDWVHVSPLAASAVAARAHLRAIHRHRRRLHAR
jgi:beta-glucanase (GH16 family)